MTNKLPTDILRDDIRHVLLCSGSPVDCEDCEIAQQHAAVIIRPAEECADGYAEQRAKHGDYSSDPVIWDAPEHVLPTGEARHEFESAGVHCNVILKWEDTPQGIPLPVYCDQPRSAFAHQPAAVEQPTERFAEGKRCCTICDALKRCHVCREQTLFACSDCAINLGATVYVCAEPKCRYEHDARCSARLEVTVSALCDAWRADTRVHSEGCAAVFSNNVPDDCGCGLTEKRDREITMIKEGITEEDVYETRQNGAGLGD